MYRLSSLVAGFALGLFFTSSDATASTVFNITGSSTYSGTLTIDTVGGSLTAADIVLSTPPDFTNILSSHQGATDFVVSISDGTTSPNPILTLSLDDGGTLVGFAGGTIDAATVIGGCDLTSEQCRGIPQTLGSADLSAETTATPLPGALPLFATGLGGLGLFGWRRKPRTQFVADTAITSGIGGG